VETDDAGTRGRLRAVDLRGDAALLFNASESTFLEGRCLWCVGREIRNGDWKVETAGEVHGDAASVLDRVVSQEEAFFSVAGADDDAAGESLASAIVELWLDSDGRDIEGETFLGGPEGSPGADFAERGAIKGDLMAGPRWSFWRMVRKASPAMASASMATRMPPANPAAAAMAVAISVHTHQPSAAAQPSCRKVPIPGVM